MKHRGFEPRTTWLKVKCSTTWANAPSVIQLAFFRRQCPEPESNQWHEDFQSSALPTELSGLTNWVAGTGFEPMTFGLWARRASRLLHPAILCCIWYVFLFKNIPEKENGWRWIRTTEANCSRFTVCPLWPLGNLPIIQFNIKLYKADDRTRTDNLLITNQLLCQLSHVGNYLNGAYRARTYDPLLVRQMLSQLS